VAALVRCEPVYEEFHGWQKDISKIRRVKDLPAEARAYVKRIEELLNCPPSIISVGERREQTILVRQLF
jgi:adenylosuccinate synthase